MFVEYHGRLPGKTHLNNGNPVSVYLITNDYWLCAIIRIFGDLRLLKRRLLWNSPGTEIISF